MSIEAFISNTKQILKIKRPKSIGCFLWLTQMYQCIRVWKQFPLGGILKWSNFFSSSSDKYMFLDNVKNKILNAHICMWIACSFFFLCITPFTSQQSAYYSLLKWFALNHNCSTLKMKLRPLTMLQWATTKAAIVSKEMKWDTMEPTLLCFSK